MWCCGPLEPLTPEEEAAFNDNKPTGDDSIITDDQHTSPSDELSTDGNDETAADESTPTSVIASSEQLVSVIIPHGVIPGQEITVKSPDGKQSVIATVPEGTKGGDTIIVKMPNAEKTSSPSEHVPSDAEEREPEEQEEQEPVVVTQEEEDTRGIVETVDHFLTPTPDGGNLHTTQATVSVIPVNRVPGQTQNAAEIKLVSGEKLNATVEHAQPAAIEHVEVEEARDMHETVEQDRSFVEVIEDWITPTPDPPMPRAQSEPRKKMLPRPEKQKEVGAAVESTTELSSQPKEQEDVSVDAAPMKRHQKLLMVQVPFGVKAGTLIHVEIPGENRTVAAQVPPDTTFFHVAYTPQLSPSELEDVRTPTPDPAGTPIPVDPPQEADFAQYDEAPRQRNFGSQDPPQQSEIPQRTPPAQASSKFVSERFSGAGRKLLLVRVPEGTLAGSTLHVSVPDEPGRILAAQVPIGNVREFHVSYEPRSMQQTRGSMLPPANPYAQGVGYPQQPPAGFYPYPGSSGSFMMPPMMGGGPHMGGPAASWGYDQYGRKIDASGSEMATTGGGRY